MRVERPDPGAVQVALKGKVAVFDFDGVLARHTGWNPPGEPIEAAWETVRHLRRAAGYQVAIVTARPVDDVVAWLERRGLHHEIALVTNRKVRADVYFEDRACRFDPQMTPEQLLRAAVEPPWWQRPSQPELP